MPVPRWLACLLVSSACAPAALAAVVYDESISGDLSGNGLVPTFVSFAAGSNVVLGSSGNPGAGVDRDYFRFTVAPGFQLVSLTVLPGSTFLGPSLLSFIAVQAGNQVSVDPNSGTAAGLLGWLHYVPGDIGNDILPKMGVPLFGSSGFMPPLPAGNYAIWTQETGAGTSAYGFDFNVAVVPEPSSAAFLLAGLAGLGLLHRRRKAHRAPLIAP